MMTKNDFAVVADVFRVKLRKLKDVEESKRMSQWPARHEYEIIRNFAYDVVDDFEKAYPRFNRKHFLTRAGITTDRS